MIVTSYTIYAMKNGKEAWWRRCGSLCEISVLEKHLPEALDVDELLPPGFFRASGTNHYYRRGHNPTTNEYVVDITVAIHGWTSTDISSLYNRIMALK